MVWAGMALTPSTMRLLASVELTPHIRFDQLQRRLILRFAGAGLCRHWLQFLKFAPVVDLVQHLESSAPDVMAHHHIGNDMRIFLCIEEHISDLKAAGRV